MADNKQLDLFESIEISYLKSTISDFLYDTMKVSRQIIFDTIWENSEHKIVINNLIHSKWNKDVQSVINDFATFMWLCFRIRLEFDGINFVAIFLGNDKINNHENGYELQIPLHYRVEGVQFESNSKEDVLRLFSGLCGLLEVFFNKSLYRELLESNTLLDYVCNKKESIDDKPKELFIMSGKLLELFFEKYFNTDYSSEEITQYSVINTILEEIMSENNNIEVKNLYNKEYNTTNFLVTDIESKLSFQLNVDGKLSANEVTQQKAKLFNSFYYTKTINFITFNEFKNEYTFPYFYVLPPYKTE